MAQLGVHTTEPVQRPMVVIPQHLQFDFGGGQGSRRGHCCCSHTCATTVIAESGHLSYQSITMQLKSDGKHRTLC